MEGEWQVTLGGNGAVSPRPADAALRLYRVLSIADRLTILYLAFVAVLVTVRQGHVRYWAEIALIHAVLITFIAMLAHLQARQSPRLEFLRHWYPTLLFGFFFEEIGFIVHAIFPGWFDHLLIAADYALFGVNPTVWIEQFSNYWLTEFLQLAYTSYLPVTIGLGAYFWRKQLRGAFEVLIVSTCITYYLGYVIFIFFPIESPYHTLAHLQKVELVGGPFSAAIGWIERYGRVHGGAFPSAHVSGSVVALVCAWRYARRLGVWLTPLVVTICISTVYGRYHYVVDVLAGVVMAVMGCAGGVLLVRRSGKQA